MHEKGSNKDGGYRRMDMSGIEKVEMDEDKSEIRFLLQKMSHNKWLFLHYHRIFIYFFPNLFIILGRRQKMN